MKHTRFRGGILGSLASLLMLLSPGSGHAQTAPNKFESLPSDGIVLATIDVGAIRNLPELELMAWEVLSAASIDRFGVDVLKVQSLEMSVGMPSPNGPEGAVIVHTSSPVDIADISMPGLGPVAASPKKADLRFRNIENAPILLMQTQPSFMVLGSEGTLRRVVVGKFPKTKAIELLQESKDPIRIVLTTDLLRPIVMGFLEDNPQRMPEELVTELLNVVEKVDHIRMTSTAGFMSKYTLDIYASSRESIQSVEQSLRVLREAGIAILEQEFQKQLERDQSITPNIKAAIDAYIVRLKATLQKELWQTKDSHIHMELEGVNSIGTIGVLTGLLLPAVQAAREAARRMESSNNLRQFQLGLLNYESAYKKFPARGMNAKDGKPLLSWRVAILPFIEENELYSQFHLDEPWDSPHNIKLLDRMPKIYENPRAGVMPPGYTNYVAPYMDQTFWSKSTAGRLRDITDGTFNTISLMETLPEKCVPWTSPQDLDITGLSAFEIILPAGSNVAFFDCSVRNIAASIDIETFRALVTSQGGEGVNPGP